MTKGYHNYRGRGGRQKRLLAVVLVLVILAATAFLVIQNYIVYDDAGKAHIEWPFRKDEPQPDDNATPPVSQDDVNIDYVDNGYAPHLQELHAQMLPGNALPPVFFRRAHRFVIAFVHLHSVTALFDNTVIISWRSPFVNRNTVFENKFDSHD